MGREVKERGARPLAKRPYPPYQRPDRKALRRYPVGPQAEPGWEPQGRPKGAPRAPARPLHPVRKPPPLYMPNVRTARFAPARILPGLGAMIVGLDIGRALTGGIVDQLARGFPQPPGERITGWATEYGHWPMSYYRSRAATPNPYSWFLNPDYEYYQVGDPIPTTGAQTLPNVGASGTRNEFWKSGALRGRWYYLSERRQLDNGAIVPDRTYWESSWVRLTTVPNTSVPTPGSPAKVGRALVPFPNPWADPNILRDAPGVRPLPGLQPAPWEYPGLAPRPGTRTSPGRIPGLAFDLAPFPDSSAEPKPEIKTDTLPRELLDRINHKRQKSRVKERKMISKAARIGIAAWGVLDTYSELSEIGGAFWDALPADLAKSAKCPKNFTLGQYGNDLNRCQAEFLVANWDKIDPVEAFKNLAKNIVEDMTIGQFHKWLAKMYPPGISWQRTAVTHASSKAQPELYISKRLKELWEFLGI